MACARPRKHWHWANKSISALIGTLIDSFSLEKLLFMHKELNDVNEATATWTKA